MENRRDYDGSPKGTSRSRATMRCSFPISRKTRANDDNRRHDEPALADELSSMAHTWLQQVKNPKTPFIMDTAMRFTAHG